MRFLNVLFGFFLLSHMNASSQKLFIDKTPFRTAILDVLYVENDNAYEAKVYVDMYGSRVVADFSGKYNNKTIDRRIMRKDGFLYFFNHDKKTIVKIPLNPAPNIYRRSNMQKDQDTAYLKYDCALCTPIDSSSVDVKAIFFDELLMQLDLPNMFYQVTNIDETSSVPPNIFALPRDYLIKSMNYNFER